MYQNGFGGEFILKHLKGESIRSVWGRIYLKTRQRRMYQICFGGEFILKYLKGEGIRSVWGRIYL